MQTIKWISFCISHAVARTVVHFYPSSGTVTAPYPVTCKFTLFGQGERGRPVTVEGLRLSQPDGVALEDVFPYLREGVDGCFGLEIALSTMQPRIDLSASDCVIEIASPAFSTRFHAHRVGNKGDTRVHSPGVLAQDQYQRSSVVVVNCEEESLEVPLTELREESEGGNSNDFFRRAVSGLSVEEYPLGEEVFGEVPELDCSWGTSRLRAAIVDGELPRSACCFVMHRDTVTNLPMSVNVI